MSVSTNDVVEAQVSEMRAARKEAVARIKADADEAIEHFENGSFDLVEEALVECREGLCCAKNHLKEVATKRRGRRRSNDSSIQSQITPA